ncbi:MAG: hypothetical protein H6672_08450 [Anaerolineaceae bacterium]|nr:hypothetical protein [Anaerolineaceae bacterium]
MEWKEHLVAIRLASDAARVHIIERHYLEPTGAAYQYTNIKTYCGVELTTPYDECQQAEINCETCVAKVEKQQAYWKNFWAGWQGKMVIDSLTGMNELREEWRESRRQTEAFLQRAQAFQDLLHDCLKHHQPVFTLELPDEVLLKLIDFGSVGEILFCFKVNDESRDKIQTLLGKEGFALLGSRLISKGLLKATDPIFNRRWT